MIVDTTVLLTAADSSHPSHNQVRLWWERQLNGVRRVGLPWPVLMDFVRISTDENLCDRALDAEAAGALVSEWLRAAPAWVPLPTERHWEVFTALLTRYPLTAAQVGQADLVALVMQNGGPLCSTDPALARFKEIEHINPLGRAAQRW